MSLNCDVISLRETERLTPRQPRTQPSHLPANWREWYQRDGGLSKPSAEMTRGITSSSLKNVIRSVKAYPKSLIVKGIWKNKSCLPLLSGQSMVADGRPAHRCRHSDDLGSGIWKEPGPRLNIKPVFPGMGIPIIKSWDCLNLMIGIPIRQYFYIETASRTWSVEMMFRGSHHNFPRLIHLLACHFGIRNGIKNLMKYLSPEVDFKWHVQ